METPHRFLEDLIARERAVVASLVESMKRFGAPAEDMEAAREALRRVTDLSLVVVAGEFDSGKSAFIDALIGVGPDVRDVAPATGWITLLRHGSAIAERTLEEGLVEKAVPAPFLLQATVADTPVTNAILRRGARATLDLARRADVILFITSAEHALTESGREFLRLLSEVSENVLLVVNKVDLLPDASDVEEVRRIVTDGALDVMGVAPPVLFVSSFLGGNARATGNAIEDWSLRVKSGFAALERRISQNLGGMAQSEVAMQATLGVAEKLGIRYRFAVDERIGLLEGDLKTYGNAAAQLEVYRTEMRRDYEIRAAQIENLVSSMNERASQWFDENTGLANVADLTRSEKVREEFERDVVAPTETNVQDWIEDLARWMGERNGERWRDLVEYVADRRQMDYVEKLMGGLEVLIAPEDRESMNGTNGVGFVPGGDPERERTKVSSSLRSAVVRTVAELGASGTGRATPETPAAPLDIGTELLAGVGKYLIPSRRRGAYDEFRARSAALRDRLGEALRTQFEAEVDAAVGRMRDAMTPHVRFMLAEKGRIIRIRFSLDEVDSELDAIKVELNALQPATPRPAAQSPTVVPTGSR